MSNRATDGRLSARLGLVADTQGLTQHHKARPQAWPLTTEACEAGRIGAI